MSEGSHDTERSPTPEREQRELCTAVGARFDPPSPEMLVVISDGVYEGDSVQGVRYLSPPHMSGWWLTTGRYDGSTQSLKPVHLRHVYETRPDLARYLALPFGYRFSSESGNVRFDEAVVRELSTLPTTDEQI
jgi:hypothetical protein